MNVLCVIKDLAVAGAKAVVGLFTSANPVAIAAGVVLTGVAVYGAIRGVKKIIKKVKQLKESKTPVTITEMALSDKETRETNPEAAIAYKKSVKKTSDILAGFSTKGKKVKKHCKKHDELTELIENIRSMSKSAKNAKKSNNTSARRPKPLKLSDKYDTLADCVENEPSVREFIYGSDEQLKDSLCY